MHAIMFWGFLALFMGTVLATIDYDITLPLFGYKLLKGDFYLVLRDGARPLRALLRRRPRHGGVAALRPAARTGSIPPRASPRVLALLFVINLTGFVMEACRLAVVKPWWAAWSPVGYGAGPGACSASGMGEGALRATHLGVWLFHAVISLFFIAIIPRSYFVHLRHHAAQHLLLQADARGARSDKIENIEEAESLGISKLEEFSWKRRLDFDACVECGRCQAACPAYLAGTALSPKQIIVKLKRHMHGELPGPIHGELIKADELWACTTCMACVQECPAFIDIVDTIIDLRRYLTLSEGALPSTAPQSLQNIQRAGNPWGLPAAERLAWAEGLDVPMLEPGKEVEYLYWVGCSASYDRRNQAIARSVVAILKKAGVSFAVMQEERCHGEVARRLGEEYLYQTLQTGERGGAQPVQVPQGHHALPALLQHHQERVPAVRRHLRGDAPLAGHRRADPERPHQADQAAGRHGGLPRLLLPRPLQRDHRGAAPRGERACRGCAWSSRRATASAVCAAAAAAATCGWRSRPRSA